MKVHFLKDEYLSVLKSNIDSNQACYQNPSNEWIMKLFSGENPFAEYKIPIGKFDFVTADGIGDQGKADVENAIRLYTAMNQISESQATDERLWAGLCHCDFWDFLQKRWNHSEKNIERRYFIWSKNGSRRGLIINTLSRLWWTAHLTYDEKRSNHFELTHYFGSNFAEKSLIIFSSNFTSSPHITRGLLSALQELENEGIKKIPHGKDIFYPATIYLNILGGTSILDYFTEEEIHDKVKNHIKSLL